PAPGRRQAPVRPAPPARTGPWLGTGKPPASPRPDFLPSVVPSPLPRRNRLSGPRTERRRPRAGVGARRFGTRAKGSFAVREGVDDVVALVAQFHDRKGGLLDRTAADV